MMKSFGFRFAAALLALPLFATAFAARGEEETPWFAGKFGTELVNASGRKVPAGTALAGKIVGVYFSASWCGPCRGFTPQLVKFHRAAAKRGGMEIVFVSCDKSQNDMFAYMRKDSMPWLALPFGSEEGKALKKELGVNGIPTLVIFGSDGKLISNNGRWDVVMLGAKALESWKSPDYKPLTYKDYLEKKGSSSADSRSKAKGKSKSRRKK